MRGGASWLGFLLIPLAIIVVFYIVKFIGKLIAKKTSADS
jgi:hypothetical protein